MSPECRVWCHPIPVPFFPGQDRSPPPSQLLGHQTLLDGAIPWPIPQALHREGTTPAPASLSGRFYTSTPPNGLCFVFLGSNKTRRQKKKKTTPTYQPRARHLCLALCGLWFQPHKTIGPGNVSKTAPAPLTCPPCHGTTVPKPPKVLGGLVPIAPLSDQSLQLLPRHCTVVWLGWRHLQRTGEKKEKKAQEGPSLGGSMAMITPAEQPGARAASLLCSQEGGVGGTDLTESHEWEETHTDH